MHKLIIIILSIYTVNGYAFGKQDTSLIKTHRQFRFHYANDVYNGTDRYLTQIAAFKFYTPFRSGRANRQIQNIYSLQQNVYTPSDIFGDTIQRNDRPYASTLAFEFSQLLFYDLSRLQLNFNLTAGSIGKYAFGEQMQREVHYAVNSRQPLGWQYQVSGAPYINFQAGIEKLLTRFKNLDYALQGQVNTGTVFNNLAFGQVIKLHSKNNYLMAMNSASLSEFRISATMKNEIKLVAWNGTLQGAIGSKGNPYVLTGKEISRIIHYNQLSFHAGYKHLDVTVSKSFLSKEFNTGLKHKWCAVEFSYLF